MRNPSLIAAAKTMICIYLEDGEPKNSANILEDLLGATSMKTTFGRVGRSEDIKNWMRSPFCQAMIELIKSNEVIASKNETGQQFYQLKRS